MSNETCAICGCDIALLPKKGAKPVRHQAQVYCGACAKVILDPATSQGAEDIEVPEPDAIDDVSTKTPVSVSAVRRATGIEVVEEFNIKAVGQPAPQRERNLDEDEWFKPGAPKAGGSNSTAVAVKNKKGGTSISKRAEPEKRAPSNRMNAAKPSDRLQKAAPKPSGRMAATETPPEERKGSRRMARPSGRLGKPSPSRASMAPAAALPAEVSPQEPELVDEANVAAAPSAAPEALAPEAPKKGDSARMQVGAGSRKSSRTMKAAKRGGSSAKSGRGDRSDRNERDERGRGAKGRGGAGNNNTMMIGLGVAGIILLVICAACLGKGTPAPEKKQNTVTAPLTSAGEYAERGRQLLAKGDRLGAAEMYSKAADAAGSDAAAEKYNMQAYEIRKFTTLNMSGGR